MHWLYWDKENDYASWFNCEWFSKFDVEQEMNDSGWQGKIYKVNGFGSYEIIEE